MELSVRLRMNADMIPEGCRLADIGCDHGYVPIYLAERARCDKILALDIGEGPLAVARKNIRRAGLSERIECRLSDGLRGLEPGEADTLLIAGMGGMLVCRILEQSPDVLAGIQTLILQPQSDLEAVRKRLSESGFALEDERCCHDGGRWYLAMRASRTETGHPAMTEEQYRYGWILQERKDPVYQEYLLREKEKTEQVMERLKVRHTAGSASRLRDLRRELSLLVDTLSRFG